MFRAYIDEAYLIHFFESMIKTERFSDEETLRKTMFDFIKSETDVFIETDFAVINGKIDARYRNAVNTLLNRLTTGRNGTIIKTGHKDGFKALNSVDVYGKIKYPFASYFVGKSYRNSLSKYSLKNPFYFVSDNNDISVWSKMSASSNYYIGQPIEGKIATELISWSDISKLSHSFRSLVISDKFCLKNRSGIIQNIVPLISNLTLENSASKEIVVFCGRGELYTDNLDEIKELIEIELVKRGVSSTVSIFSTAAILHDRYVVTNNCFIRSGDSFSSYFDGERVKTKGTLFDFKPIFIANKTEVVNVLLSFKKIAVDSHNYVGTKEISFFDYLNNL